MAYQQFTLSQLQTLMTERVDSSPFWTNAESTSAINEALLMWNLLTGFWKDTVTFNTTANNWDYALPASIVFGMRVEFNSKPLAQSSLAEMDDGHPGWQEQTTTTGGNVPTEPKYWFPLSIDMIGIWPADAAGGNVITVDGVSATPRLVNSGDYIDIGNEQLNAVLGYALHYLALKEGGERFASSMPYYTDFLKAAAEENDQLTSSSIFRSALGLDLTRQMPPKRGGKTDYDDLSSPWNNLHGGRQL